MTKEEMDFIGSMNMCDEISNEAYQKIMAHCEEQEPCEDCISRQAATKAICEDGTWLESQGCTEITMVERKQRDADILGELPSVTPQPKTGKWIKKDGFDGDTYYDCSECGESWTTIDGTPWDNGMKFCPNCGAKMEVSE